MTTRLRNAHQLLRTQSQFEFPKSHDSCIEWLQNLQVAWQMEKSDSAFLENDENYVNPVHLSRSPVKRRRQRLLNIDKLITNLNTNLPIKRNGQLQVELERLVALMIPKCNSHQKKLLNDLMHTYKKKYTIQEQTNISDNKSKDSYIDELISQLLEDSNTSMILDELLEIPQSEWTQQRIDALLFVNGELTNNISTIVYPIIKAWTKYESGTENTLLREDTPLRFLLRALVNYYLRDTEEITTVSEGLQLISLLPKQLRKILKYQTRQFLHNNLEITEDKGVCLVHFIYFSCLIPMITSLESKKQLHKDFLDILQLPVPPAEYLRARKKIAGHLSITTLEKS